MPLTGPCKTEPSTYNASTQKANNQQYTTQTNKHALYDLN